MATDQASSTGRNPSIRLAIIRGRIDATQQVIAELEQRLQQAILGGTQTEGPGGNTNLTDILGTIRTIYGDGAAQANSLTEAFAKGVANFNTGAIDLDAGAEQDGIRQLLYQARALMGELRVEEQHWNGEVNEEKQRRKELADFTKA
jgi:hypothetical protein